MKKIKPVLKTLTLTLLIALMVTGVVFLIDDDLGTALVTAEHLVFYFVVAIASGCVYVPIRYFKKAN